MTLKKLLSVLLVVAMVCIMANGCGSSGSNSNTSNDTTSDAAQNKQSNENNATEIVVTFLTFGQTPKDLPLVQDEVNKITVPKIGVKIKFYPIPIADTFTKYSTLLAGKENIDLMITAFQDIQPFVNSGSLMPLDNYISENSNIQKLIEEYGVTDGAKIDGKTYGIGPTTTLGFQGAVILGNDYLKNAGLTIDTEKEYSLEELSSIFGALKKANPNVYPCGALGSSVVNGASSFRIFHVIDSLGANTTSGVLMDTTSTKIVDMYETEEYYNFLKAMKEWYKAGYIMPDAATNDTPADTLIMSGVLGSSIMNNNPAVLASLQAKLKGGGTPASTTPVYRPSVSSATGIYSTVPTYSKKAEAALKFLDLTFADDSLSNLLQWGIEGKHYKVVDEANGIIDFADGLDATTSGYYNTLGVWGNQNNLLTFSKFSTKAANLAYIEKARANPTKAVGYQYNSSKMVNQLVAINTVLNQYLPTLETGSEKDLDTTYNAFIKALKAANIDAVIADNQAQFDAWLANR